MRVHASERVWNATVALLNGYFSGYCADGDMLYCKKFCVIYCMMLTYIQMEMSLNVGGKFVT